MEPKSINYLIINITMLVAPIGHHVPALKHQHKRKACPLHGAKVSATYGKPTEIKLRSSETLRIKFTGIHYKINEVTC